MKKYKKMDKEQDVFTWEPTMVLEYFNKKGISRSEIEYISSQKSLVSRVFDTAELFREYGFHNFSGTDLASLIYWHRWGETKKKSFGLLSNIYQFLSRHYEINDKLQKGIADDIGMPYIHLLRIQTGNNKSNLHVIRGYQIQGDKLIKVEEPIYPEIKISPHDLQDGVTLPLRSEIDFDTAKLFGYIWSCGSLIRDRIYFSGKNKYKDLFKNELKPICEKIFNVDFTITKQRSQEAQLGTDLVKLEGIILRRCSRAISSYLSSVHGFPIDSWEDLEHLPNIPWTEDTINGFITGVIKIRGRDGTFDFNPPRDYKMERLEIEHRGKTLGKRMSFLLKNAGQGHCGPTFMKRPERANTWTITFQKDPTLYFRKFL